MRTRRRKLVGNYSNVARQRAAAMDAKPKPGKYFFSDWDEAKAFERMFDGDFAYSENGYTITI